MGEKHHIKKGLKWQCPYKTYEESQDREYPCVDAQDRSEFEQPEMKEAECRCKTKMEEIAKVGTQALMMTYWCPMCGAIQKVLHRNSILDSIGVPEIKFKLPEMTADLPFDGS